MEKLKLWVVDLLNRATARYLTRGEVRVIAVAGSVGKTSTAAAIRTVLSQKYTVHMPSTAYNTNKSIHLEIFKYPYATSTLGWALVSCKMLFKAWFTAPDFEVLVAELGTDHPGELASFAFLQPHIGVLTAVAPEHMEYFHTLAAVANEEMTLADFSRRMIINCSMVERQYIPDDIWRQAAGYGEGTTYDYSNYRFANGQATVDLSLGEQQLKDVPIQLIGEHSMHALLVAGLLAEIYRLDSQQLIKGLKAVKPVHGRMQLMKGVGGAMIVDDTYNASPEACKAAMDVLYSLPGRRIAILGSMNELGGYSALAHRELGAYCDPGKLDMVVTIGQEAGLYLAPAARERGCRVEPFDSPYDAARFLYPILTAQQPVAPGAVSITPSVVVLAKGSQNGVFCEEAVKLLLADPTDVIDLVRQSPFWMEQKAAQFGPPPSFFV